MIKEPKIVIMDRVLSRLEIESIKEPEALFATHFWGPIQDVIKAAKEAGIPWDRVYARYWILEQTDHEG